MSNYEFIINIYNTYILEELLLSSVCRSDRFNTGYQFLLYYGQAVLNLSLNSFSLPKSKVKYSGRNETMG